MPRAIGELESPRRRGPKRAEGGRRAVRADGEGRTRDGAARGREAGRPRGAPAGAVGLLLAVRNCGDGGCYGNPGATLEVQNRDRTRFACGGTLAL